MPLPEPTRLIRESDLVDLVAGIKALDRALGADDRSFRYRVRQWLQTHQDLRQRRRLAAEVGRD